MSKKSSLADLVEIKGSEVFAYNGVFVGHILEKEDGFYDFWPKHDPGTYWDSSMLKAITAHLDTLNAPWEKEINDYFAKDSDANRVE